MWKLLAVDCCKQSKQCPLPRRCFQELHYILKGNLGGSHSCQLCAESSRRCAQLVFLWTLISSNSMWMLSVTTRSDPVQKFTLWWIFWDDFLLFWSQIIGKFQQFTDFFVVGCRSENNLVSASGLRERWWWVISLQQSKMKFFVHYFIE